jgi:acyl-CoA synthetase (AMP-forming)/AMP-acid ligase II
MSALGVGPGERVAVLSHNRPEVLHLWLGCERAAVVRVVLHSHLDMTEHVAMVACVQAVALVFDTRFTAVVEGHRDDTGSVNLFIFIAIGEDPPPWGVAYEDFLAHGQPIMCPIDVDENTPIASDRRRARREGRSLG